MNSLLHILIILALILQISCGSGTQAQNYKKAYLVTANDLLFLKLKGRRVPIHQNGTYEDSIFIPIPKLFEGRIEGKEIPVIKGNFAFKGYILIDKNTLEVNLLVDDTTNNKLRPLSWNGKYILIQ